MMVSLAQIREKSGDVFTDGCPTRVVLDHIMSKWGVLVLLALTDLGRDLMDRKLPLVEWVAANAGRVIQVG